MTSKLTLEQLYAEANKNDSDFVFWSGYSGRIELVISKEDSRSGYHRGECDADIQALSEAPYIQMQLEKLDPTVIASELKSYGAWDDEELKDHEQNIQRLLWLACGDIVDNPEF